MRESIVFTNLNPLPFLFPPPLPLSPSPSVSQLVSAPAGSAFNPLYTATNGTDKCGSVTNGIVPAPLMGKFVGMWMDECVIVCGWVSVCLHVCVFVFDMTFLTHSKFGGYFLL